MRKIPTFAALGFLAAGSFAMSGAAFAAPVQLSKEIAAAATHAGLAAAGGDVATVHTHLHHTINCLVGPKGDGFAPKEMNPCAQLGNGAIPDSGSDEPTKSALQAALATAQSGVVETDLDKAKIDASDTQAALDTLK